MPEPAAVYFTFSTYGENRKPPRGESARVQPAVPLGGSVYSPFLLLALCLSGHSARAIWLWRGRRRLVGIIQASRGTSGRSEGASLKTELVPGTGIPVRAARLIITSHHIVGLSVWGRRAFSAWLHSVGIPQRSAKLRTPPRLGLIPRRD